MIPFIPNEFLPTFTINNNKIDAGQIEVYLASQNINGLVSLNYTSTHESGDVYGTGGKITGFTKGINRGGTGSITMYYEDFTAFFNNQALNLIDFYQQTYDLNVAYVDLLVKRNALNILGMKFTDISQAYDTQSADALVVDLSFKFIDLQENYKALVATKVVDLIRSNI